MQWHHPVLHIPNSRSGSTGFPAGPIIRHHDIMHRHQPRYPWGGDHKEVEAFISSGFYTGDTQDVKWSCPSVGGVGGWFDLFPACPFYALHLQRLHKSIKSFIKLLWMKHSVSEKHNEAESHLLTVCHIECIQMAASLRHSAFSKGPRRPAQKFCWSIWTCTDCHLF